MTLTAQAGRTGRPVRPGRQDAVRRTGHVAVYPGAGPRRWLTQRRICSHGSVPAKAGHSLILRAGSASGTGRGQVAGAGRLSRPAVAGLQAAGSNLFRGRAGGRVAAAAAAVEDFFLANLVAWDKRSCIKGTVL